MHPSIQLKTVVLTFNLKVKAQECKSGAECTFVEALFQAAVDILVVTIINDTWGWTCDKKKQIINTSTDEIIISRFGQLFTVLLALFSGLLIAPTPNIIPVGVLRFQPILIGL